MAPVDPEGKFTAEAGDLQGDSVFKADQRIIQKLKESGALLKEERLSHSYPHCWRCKNPVIFRATEQWFISMEKKELRGAALRAIDQVRWIPPWGKDRIRGMLEARPDWCISRQRSWGVPIPAVYCKECNEVILSQELCEHVAAVFETDGSDAWYTREPMQLVPPNLTCPRCGGRDFSREEDILDVWFDSGISHAAVVERDPRLGGVADMYLEGSDQHRGWFHTSLLTSVATRGRAPYESVLTHGFTLDGKGRKMSKSLGNTVAPQETMKKFGAEILRLWVSAEDYREDVRISDEILNRLVEAYRRLRNTARFLISNLYDFDPEEDAVDKQELDELDRWILHRTQDVLKRCREAYDKYEFHVVYHTLNNFCSVDLSALYLDIVKDRLYCEGAKSKKRRAAQSTLYRILEVLVHLMAPILSFTAEEIWGYVPGKERQRSSVFLSSIPEPDPTLVDPKLADKWDRLFRERTEVLKALEEARNLGIIGHSLDANVSLYPELYKIDASLWKNSGGTEGKDILIVSNLELDGTEDPGDTSPESLRSLQGAAEPFGPADESGLRNAKIRYGSPLFGGPIVVSRAKGGKCQRCWKYDEAVGKDSTYDDVCPRCAEVLRSGVSA